MRLKHAGSQPSKLSSQSASSPESGLSCRHRRTHSSCWQASRQDQCRLVVTLRAMSLKDGASSWLAGQAAFPHSGYDATLTSGRGLADPSHQVCCAYTMSRQSTSCHCAAQHSVPGLGCIHASHSMVIAAFKHPLLKAVGLECTTWPLYHLSHHRPRMPLLQRPQADTQAAADASDQSNEATWLLYASETIQRCYTRVRWPQPHSSPWMCDVQISFYCHSTVRAR